MAKADAVPAQLLEPLNVSEFQELLGLAARRSERHLEKYTNLDSCMRRAWQQLNDLELNQRSNILDIGTGSGFFLYVCQKQGHHCVGLDRPESSPLLLGIRKWLGVNVIDHAIKRYESMPSLGRFDVATAYRAQFNSCGGDRLWNLDEWTFFLDDLRDNVLKRNGRLVIKFAGQDMKATRGGIPHTEPRMVRFLSERGALIRGAVADFNPLL